MAAFVVSLLVACGPAPTYTPEELAYREEQQRLQTESWCRRYLRDYLDTKAAPGGFAGGYFVGSYESRCRGVTIR